MDSNACVGVETRSISWNPFIGSYCDIYIGEVIGDLRSPGYRTAITAIKAVFIQSEGKMNKKN